MQILVKPIIVCIGWSEYVVVQADVRPRGCYGDACEIFKVFVMAAEALELVYGGAIIDLRPNDFPWHSSENRHTQ